MHSVLPLLTALLTLPLALAQDGRTLVTNFRQTIGLANGGIGGQANCQITGNLDRGAQPIAFTVQRGCGTFQDGGAFGRETITFDDNPDLSMVVSCDVKAGECGTFFNIRVETTDGYCNQGATYRIDCPETDFRKRSVVDVHARQEPPTGLLEQCYGDVLLVECFD
ncbi:hypothetical protein PRZ48_009222 [Zasmidium cellare]|uniref:Uncharacterized protein n=1 Tax=Zasmidium cellare TaxID=395010 RepID=A0ABR0EB47_ZASCE|nr:hypothetical protein PRZ48_009222 [Zasmidium cellare]